MYSIITHWISLHGLEDNFKLFMITSLFSHCHDSCLLPTSWLTEVWEAGQYSSFNQLFFKVLISFLRLEQLFFRAWLINLRRVKTKESWRRGQRHLSSSIIFWFPCPCILKKMSCLSSCKKIALAYLSLPDTHHNHQWLLGCHNHHIGFTQFCF